MAVVMEGRGGVAGIRVLDADGVVDPVDEGEWLGEGDEVV